MGVDSNAESVDRARARCGPRRTVQCLPYTSVTGEFDIVVCSEVIEHVADLDHILDWLCDRVSSGGYLSISTPSGWMYRSPRLYNIYKCLQSPRRFVRLYLQPENQWCEAVVVHPVILPGKLRRRLEARGFALVLRLSALWWVQEPGALTWVFGRLGSSRAAATFYHWCRLLDSLLNVAPPLRCFESRAVLFMQRR